MKKPYLLILLIIGLALLSMVAAANEPPKAKGSADAFSCAKAVSSYDYDPFSVAWTSTWSWADAKIDPISISGSTGQAFAVIDSFALADAYSNAFAVAQGPNWAETETTSSNYAEVTDTSAWALAESHAEALAY